LTIAVSYLILKFVGLSQTRCGISNVEPPQSPEAPGSLPEVSRPHQHIPGPWPQPSLPAPTRTAKHGGMHGFFLHPSSHHISTYANLCLPPLCLTQRRLDTHSHGRTLRSVVVLKLCHRLGIAEFTTEASPHVQLLGLELLEVESVLKPPVLLLDRVL